MCTRAELGDIGVIDNALLCITGLQAGGAL